MMEWSGDEGYTVWVEGYRHGESLLSPSILLPGRDLVGIKILQGDTYIKSGTYGVGGTSLPVSVSSTTTANSHRRAIGEFLQSSIRA